MSSDKRFLTFFSVGFIHLLFSVDTAYADNCFISSGEMEINEVTRQACVTYSNSGNCPNTNNWALTFSNLCEENMFVEVRGEGFGFKTLILNRIKGLIFVSHRNTKLLTSVVSDPALLKQRKVRVAKKNFIKIDYPVDNNGKLQWKSSEQFQIQFSKVVSSRIPSLRRLQSRLLPDAGEQLESSKAKRSVFSTAEMSFIPTTFRAVAVNMKAGEHFLDQHSKMQGSQEAVMLVGAV